MMHLILADAPKNDFVSLSPEESGNWIKTAEQPLLCRVKEFSTYLSKLNEVL